MNSDNGDYILDRAELALLSSSNGGRLQSEASFLQRLLRDGGCPVSVFGLSPARLFREAVRHGSLQRSTQNRLKIIAMPSSRPDVALRAGDWMIRAVPGTGDVGHVCVLACADLLARFALASEGIAAESAQPGFYGTVIEGGAYPHTRKEPFARRFLDDRGRVPPHSVIVRAQSEEVDALEDYTPPTWLKDRERSPTRIIKRPAESIGETETSEDFTPPSWLKVSERARRASIDTEFEVSEAFTFEPTAMLTDFGPKLRKAWHAMMETLFQRKIDLATRKIAFGLSITEADAAKYVRFFSPASRPASITLTGANVPWNAFPIRWGSPSPSTYKLVDEPDLQTSDVLQKNQMLRIQDEYCEWQVFRNSANKIVRVVFTSEPPEYYQFLYEPGVAALRKFSRDLLVSLYQARCDTKAITLADLEGTDVTGATVYDPGNKWNNQYCVHLQMPANTLGAQVDIAARAAVLRSHGGKLITDVKKLINCDGFGDPRRQSDPTIGDNVNKLARENQFITLENPVGLYMAKLDTSGWKTPDGTDAQTFWKVLRGKADKDPHKSMIVRAEFAVPKSQGYTVSDIKIAGVPIDFGSQIAEHLDMRLGARFGPKDKDPGGATISAPKPVDC